MTKTTQNYITKDIENQYNKVIRTVRENTIYPKIYQGEFSKITITVIHRNLTLKTETVKLIVRTKNKEYNLPDINIQR